MLTIGTVMLVTTVMVAVALYATISRLDRGWAIPWALGGAGVSLLVSVVLVQALAIDAPPATWTMSSWALLSMVPPGLAAAMTITAMTHLMQPLPELQETEIEPDFRRYDKETA
ncbi:MAG: hypothetical protein Alpg2KO_24250 [Alphaproteobacteria bacterium]